MSQRITHVIEQRRTGLIVKIFVDGHKVAQQTCHTEEYANRWAEQRIEELKAEVRQ
jgi:hypothetical protein